MKVWVVEYGNTFEGAYESDMFETEYDAALKVNEHMAGSHAWERSALRADVLFWANRQMYIKAYDDAVCPASLIAATGEPPPWNELPMTQAPPNSRVEEDGA